MQTLSELYAQISGCHACADLARARNHVVPGEGSDHAQIVFIGEAPGYHEDQQGRPFVGQAGQFLELLLSSIKLKRSDVYICNVIKCRPPNNRDPMPTEIQACEKWLNRQLEIISPRMIVTLGRYSLAKFFPGESISKIHGKEKRRDSVIYYPMYHPAAALHQQSLRKIIEADMLNIPDILAREQGAGEDGAKPQQLSLF
ncbi:MAG: uracil-DNA glycosylase [Dehalococcoidia bacterium]|nr:uracil-DNA glycosylase [Dehalococcoidia bacterium]